MYELYLKHLEMANKELSEVTNRIAESDKKIADSTTLMNELRPKAFPAKGVKGSDKDVADFQEAIKLNGFLKRQLIEDNQALVRLNKTLSALRHFEFEYGKNIPATGIDCKNMTPEIADTIDSMTKVLVLNKQDDLEVLKSFGIDVDNAPKGKFVSIQHLLRPFTDFEKLTIPEYCTLVGYERLEDEPFETTLEGIYRKAVEAKGK